VTFEITVTLPKGRPVERPSPQALANALALITPDRTHIEIRVRP
jgi:hypothetical protein